MNKRAARILILFLVFAASVGVFTHLMSHETTENATDLDAASLPVLYMKTADTTVNRMYGYRQEMNGVTTRENLTPLPTDRSLTLEIDAKGQKIKNVTYTVESTDGGALIENSVLKSFDEDGSYLKADFQLETAILMNQEYTLKLEVAYGNGQSAWYYTRIVQRNGVEVISSGPLAEACDVNASQVRKDLAYFGEFGVRGVGYNVASLIAAIKASLGVDREWRAALIGVGNLGRALLHHAEFKARGFNIVGAFDCDPFKIGEQVYGLEVTCTSDLKSAVDAKGIEIGIITTPPERAQRAADHLVEAGVCGILNFAGARIHVPEKVVVEYVDFFHYLYALAFSITGSEHRSK